MLTNDKSLLAFCFFSYRNMVFVLCAVYKFIFICIELKDTKNIGVLHIYKSKIIERSAIE